MEKEPNNLLNGIFYYSHQPQARTFDEMV